MHTHKHLVPGRPFRSHGTPPHTVLTRTHDGCTGVKLLVDAPRRVVLGPSHLCRIIPRLRHTQTITHRDMQCTNTDTDTQSCTTHRQSYTETCSAPTQSDIQSCTTHRPSHTETYSAPTQRLIHRPSHTETCRAPTQRLTHRHVPHRDHCSLHSD